MQIENPEDILQVQEHFDEAWYPLILDWLKERGWDWGQMKGHRNDGSFYLVSGMSPRGVNHICIYKDGKLWHDPHPSASGLATEEWFEYFERIT